MSRQSEVAAYVALFRGINVGGNNLLPMKALAAIFQDLGCSDVRTYIQSGNVVFRAHGKVAAEVSGKVSGRVQAEFGFAVPVILRRADEMGTVIEAQPFAEADLDAVHVFFLADAPGDVSGLDPQRSPGDEYIVKGREIYARLPNGMGRTKLTNAYFDSRLKTVSTHCAQAIRDDQLGAELRPDE